MIRMVLRLPTGPVQRSADAAVVVLALAGAYLLKDYYSGADFEGLRWVLAPTTGLVQWLTGAGFEVEAHHGYISRELYYAIVPSCSGVNFMIAAFCSVACGLVHTRRNLRAKLTLLPIAAVAAYGATILANAVRIAIAIRLHVAGVALGPLTADRIHRLEGIVVYFLFLCVTFAVAARLVTTRHESAVP